MGAVLMFSGQVPVIKVGRMAGQFAKPRSDAFDERAGVKLLSYRGDNINGNETSNSWTTTSRVTGSAYIRNEDVKKCFLMVRCHWMPLRSRVPMWHLLPNNSQNEWCYQ